MKKMTITCFVLTALFSYDVSSQSIAGPLKSREKPRAFLPIESMGYLPNFQGSYDARNSPYSLLIEKDSLENYKFISYSFVSNLDEDGYIYYERQPAPGIEKFLKEERGRLISTYQIKKQDYFVTVTYGFVDESESLLIATFNGTYKGKPYFNQIEYYKLNPKDYAVKK